MKYLVVFLFIFLVANGYSQSDDTNDKFITSCAKGELSKVRNYLKRGVDINARNRARWTALAYACRYGHRDIIKLLVENGADVNQTVNTGSTPLYLALNEGYYDIADYLIKHKADVNIADIMGMSPLAWAVKNGNLKMTKYLVEHGANINAINNNSRSILDISEKDDVSKYLRSKGAYTTKEMIEKNK